MPHRKRGSPHYYIRPTVTVPGRGTIRLPERSAGTRSKAVAEAMEGTLRELPMMGYADLIERYEQGEVTATELHTAKLCGRLQLVRDQANDPPLLPLLEEFEPKDDRVGYGARRLPELIARVRSERGQVGAPRLSWLLDPANVQRVLEARERDGVKRNSVRRSELRAVADFLRRHPAVSKSDRVEMLAALDFAPEDDERDVFLSPEELRTLLRETCDPLFREAVCLVIGSGIDRAPLLRIRPRDFRDPVLQVHDRKTAGRRRALELGEAGAAALRRAIGLSRAGPGDRVFAWTKWQVRKRWDATRRRADLEHVRFKDLRGIFATYFLLAGGSVKDLQQILGHLHIETTLRYVKRLPQKRAADMTAAERSAGLKIIMGAVA